MNPKRRMLIGMVVMPLVFIILIGTTFVKNYFSSNYNDVISSVYINSGKSLLVAVKSSNSSINKIKFFEIDPTANQVKNSFSLNTNTVNSMDLKYDNDKTLITVINDDSKNTALSVYYIYEYESGSSEPELISSDMQSDTSLKNLFDWRDGLAIIDKDIKGDEAAVYIKDGNVTKKLLATNSDIANNIKRYANETSVSKTDELPYAELNLYSGKNAYVGMFLDQDGNFPVVIDEKDTALNKLAGILYRNTKLIKLFESGDGYRAGLYSYGKESAKKLLEPSMAIYNARAFYPDMDTTIVVGTTQKAVNSKLVGYIYDNKTGALLNDFSDKLNAAAGIDVTSVDNIYVSNDVLCILGDNNYYTVDLQTGTVSAALYTDIIHTINNYDKYQFASLYDYAMSGQGSMLMYNLALWLAFPLVLLAFLGISRYQKNELAKRSKLISATITSINPTSMRMYGMAVMDFEVEAYISGALKKFKIRNPVPPNQFPMVGQSIVILYDQQTGRATFADDQMVNIALGKPVIEEAVVNSIEKLDINVSGAELLRLYVSLAKDRNVIVKVPALQSEILPFNVGEKISIRYMSNSMDDTAIVLGRGKNISAERTNYTGQAEIINARGIGPAIDGRYIMDIDAVCKAKTGSVHIENIMLTKDMSVLQPGVKIMFAAEKELFEKRLRLQNMQQDNAIVSEIESTGDSVGYSPVLKIKLKIVNGDGQYTELTAIENISPLSIPNVGDRVLIGYDIATKEATIMKRL